jgi:hypothetical protein
MGAGRVEGCCRRSASREVIPHVARRTRFAQWALGIAIFFIIAIAQGYDLSWDVQAYHFYNGFAVVHGKIWSNIQVAMQASYFSPLLDIPFYLLVANLPATVVPLVLAFVQSLLYPLLFLLGWEVLAPIFGASRGLLFVAMLLAIVAVAAPVNILEIGGASGDNTTAVPAIGATLLLMSRGMNRPARRVLYWAGAGALAGLAARLKLTNLPLALGIAVALPCGTAGAPTRQHANGNPLNPSGWLRDGCRITAFVWLVGHSSGSSFRKSVLSAFQQYFSVRLRRTKRV